MLFAIIGARLQLRQHIKNHVFSHRQEGFAISGCACRNGILMSLSGKDSVEEGRKEGNMYGSESLQRFVPSMLIMSCSPS